MKIKKTILWITIFLVISLIFNIYLFFNLFSGEEESFQENFTFKSQGLDYSYIFEQIDFCKNLCDNYDSCSYNINREENKELCCLIKFDTNGETLIPPSECIVIPRQ